MFRRVILDDALVLAIPKARAVLFLAVPKFAKGVVGLFIAPPPGDCAVFRKVA